MYKQYVRAGLKIQNSGVTVYGHYSNVCHKLDYISLWDVISASIYSDAG